MPSGSTPGDSPLSPAQITPSSPSADGYAPKTSSPAMPLWQRAKVCEWCLGDFLPQTRQAQRKNRFCDQSCSAKWRMSHPVHKAKVHRPEVYAKIGRSVSARYKAGDSPKLEANRERIRALRPTPESRAKISRRLREIGHGPSVRGGNGHGLTEPQRILLDALGPSWRAEFAISLGQRTPGYPTNYKVDLALPERRVAIEADGHTHRSRKAQDEKKDAKLRSLGWIVLRFWNRDILTWSASGHPMEHSISMTLKAHGILPFPSTDGSSTTRGV